MSYNSFVYDLPDNTSKSGSSTTMKCMKKVTACPLIGDVQYYEWRFLNFMERHITCSHEPPVYYYGPLEEVKYKVEKTDKIKDFIKEQWIPELIESIQKVKEVVIPLQLEDRLDEVQKNGKKVKPIISKSYGYKYCFAFDKLLYPKLTPAGQEWEKKALKYLQKNMELGLVELNWIAICNKKFNKEFHLEDTKKRNNFYKNIELNNEYFQSFAFATHPDSYLIAGLKRLPASDLLKIIATPDIKEWLDGDTWDQAWLVAKQVVPAKLEEYKADVEQFIGETYEKGSEYADKAVKIIEDFFDNISR